MYFTKPEQLLDIFTEMEEKSLPLVEKSQYTSEILDRIHITINNTLVEQNHESEQLEIKINQLEESIKREIERETSCQNTLLYFFYRRREKNHFIIYLDNIKIKKMIHLLNKYGKRLKFYIKNI